MKKPSKLLYLTAGLFVLLTISRTSAQERSTAAANEDRASVVQSVSKAESITAGAIAVGAILAAILITSLWRRRINSPQLNSDAALRVGDAVRGLPSDSAISHWSEAQVLGVIRRMAEADGYIVSESGNTLYFFRASLPGPCVAVKVISQTAHRVTEKQVKALAGELRTARTAWTVALAGFTSEAHKCANGSELVLIDAKRLAGMLREVPPILMERVLGDLTFATSS